MCGGGKVALKKQSTHRYTKHIHSVYANLNFQITFIVSLQNSPFYAAPEPACVCLFMFV